MKKKTVAHNVKMKAKLYESSLTFLDMFVPVCDFSSSANSSFHSLCVPLKFQAFVRTLCVPFKCLRD